jgi:hypothetical protein
VAAALSGELVGDGVGVLGIGVAAAITRELVGDGVDVLVGRGGGTQAFVMKKSVAISAAIEPTALESLLSGIVPRCLLWRGNVMSKFSAPTFIKRDLPAGMWDV